MDRSRRGVAAIRRATPADWPLIEVWRATHYLEIAARQTPPPRPVTGQRGLSDACWVVYERRGKPVAAFSFTDDEATRIRTIHDLYGAQGFGVSTLALGKVIEDMSDRDGYEIRCTTDPENLKFVDTLLRRGYEVTAIELKRQPRGHHGSI